MQLVNQFTVSEIINILSLLAVAVSVLYIYILKSKIEKIETAHANDMDNLVYEIEAEQTSTMTVAKAIRGIETMMKLAKSTRKDLMLTDKISAINTAIDTWEAYNLSEVLDTLRYTDKELTKLEDKYGMNDEEELTEEDHIEDAGIDQSYELGWQKKMSSNWQTA